MTLMKGKMDAHIADTRNISLGFKIPSEGYCDQPYIVVNDDGSWTCVMTTGNKHEGSSGQHIVAAVSNDHGRTWSELYDIEPASGPEASWAMPLLIPRTGRIYVFYTYNKQNLRNVKAGDGRFIDRVDSLGAYAYKYSDDKGRTWSSRRFEIPMRKFDCDRRNVYGGRVMFFWGVGKPFIHKGAAYVCASKVANFGEGFFAGSEGVLFRSPNILEEDEAANHEWETLPEGDVGIRTPLGGGPIAEEFNVTPMNDGSLYGTFRTVDGWSCRAYSRDDGWTWDVDWMTYIPGGKRVKNPRAANFVRRFSNGKYLYWFCFNGGLPLKENISENLMGYAHRNPIWLCGGVERDGFIHWSQPEIILYDKNTCSRMSYPDFVEQDGRYYFTETQKKIARVHELDVQVLENLWRRAEGEWGMVAKKGLVLEHLGCNPEVGMPGLPLLCGKGRTGVSIEISFRLKKLIPWQVLFDSRDKEGRGMLLQLTDRASLKISISGRIHTAGGACCTGNSMNESSWECDAGLVREGRSHHAVFIVDGGPKIISVLIDGVLCDGGDERQFGWGRFHPDLKEVNGTDRARIGPGLDGIVGHLRIYDRALLTAEAYSNYAAYRHRQVHSSPVPEESGRMGS